LAALILTASAYADAIFTPGNHPQPNEENIIFQDQMGATTQGFTDRSDTMVEFSTLGNILMGQGAVINAQRGNVINNITMCQDTPSSMPLSIHTSQELTTAL